MPTETCLPASTGNRLRPDILLDEIAYANRNKPSRQRGLTPSQRTSLAKHLWASRRHSLAVMRGCSPAEATAISGLTIIDRIPMLRDSE